MAQQKTLAVSVAISGILILVLLTATPSKATAQPRTACAAWHDDFRGRQLDPARWLIAGQQAPGYIPEKHIGYYQPDGVSVRGGHLALRLTQEVGAVDSNPVGVISQGALISTRTKCGYGTYTWRMRMSSTAKVPSDPGISTPGSVSAGFIFVNNSETEIDAEFSGAAPLTLYLVNWFNPGPSTGPDETKNQTVTAVEPFDSTSEFHTYKFVWKPSRISFFIDGDLRAVHTTNVPSAPAYFVINHWGTDGQYWGGPASIGYVRYFFVDRVT